MIGIEFGKHTGHSAIAILEKNGDDLSLVYMNKLPLETPCTAVIGTVRGLDEAYPSPARCFDKNRVGEGPCEKIRLFMRV